MGGSANTGITSGLDKPRQGYKNPGLIDFFPTKRRIVVKQKKCFHNTLKYDQEKQHQDF
jgi:hypothetical protein